MKPDFFETLARGAVAPGRPAASGCPEASAGSGASPAAASCPSAPRVLPEARRDAPARVPPLRAAPSAREGVAGSARPRVVRTPPRLDLGSYLDRRRGRP